MAASENMNVIEGVVHMQIVKDGSQRANLAAALIHPRIARFAAVATEVKQLHSVIMAVLCAIGVNPMSFAHLGLIVYEEVWGEMPPQSASQAFDQIRMILVAIGGMVRDNDKGLLIVPDYKDIFFGQYREMFRGIQTLLRSHENEERRDLSTASQPSVDFLKLAFCKHNSNLKFVYSSCTLEG